MNKNELRVLGIAATLLFLSLGASAAHTSLWKYIDPPAYPSSALTPGIEGQVLVEFGVDGKGRLTDPKIVHAVPAGVFEETVLKDIRSRRFNLDTARESNQPPPHAARFQFQIDPCAEGPFYLGGEDGPSTVVCVSAPPRKPVDGKFIEAALKEQRAMPAYATALHETEAVEAQLTSERTEARPTGVDRAVKTQWLVPVIPPSVRRSGKSAAAAVKFSITGAGRAQDITPIDTGSDAELTTALTQAVSSWLFEPAVDGNVGVIKTGYLAVVTVGFKNDRTGPCVEPELRGKIDFEVHLCFLRPHN